MLPKENRLKKQKDFERVFSGGKGLREDFFSIRFLENGLQWDRFGFIVGKKVSPRATKRNQIKRRMRAAVFGLMKKETKPRRKKFMDIAIIAFAGSEKLKFSQIKEAMSSVLRRLNYNV